ncbi:MAG: OsmC family protein [Bacillota bacterium]|jgi:putative redox protein
MPQETKHATVAWRRDLEFEGGMPGGPTAVTDGHGVAGPSPVELLLVAVAGCTGADVISILEKMRMKVAAFRIEVAGLRREEMPRRFLSIHLVYHVTGTGLDEGKIRHAVDLSLEKYCSVTHSLAGDIALTYDVALG